MHSACVSAYVSTTCSRLQWPRQQIATSSAPADNFNEALATLAGASDKLGAPALAQLLRELGQAATEALAANRSDELGMEMATAMLFVEQGLDQVLAAAYGWSNVFGFALIPLSERLFFFDD